MKRNYQIENWLRWVHNQTFGNYNGPRNAYLPNDLHDYSTNDLLHDREQLSEQDNESLFLKVQEFIIKSERFRPTN